MGYLTALVSSPVFLFPLDAQKNLYITLLFQKFFSLSHRQCPNQQAEGSDDEQSDNDGAVRAGVLLLFTGIFPVVVPAVLRGIVPVIAPGGSRFPACVRADGGTVSTAGTAVPPGC